MLLTLAAGTAQAENPGSWKLHPTSDGNIFRIYDTPTRTYMLGGAQPFGYNNPSYLNPYFFVFYYDKENDGWVSMSRQNKLSENVGTFAAYNAQKRYLLVVYDNSNIDLIYDSGKVVNVPGLMQTTMSSSKKVNSVTFDSERNRAYLATDFGYIVINDEKGEISESKNLGKVIDSVTRIDDRLLMLIDGVIYDIDVNVPVFNFEDCRQALYCANGVEFLPLSGSLSGIMVGADGSYRIHLLSYSDGILHDEVIDKYGLSRNEIVANRDGYLLATAGAMVILNRDGSTWAAGREGDDATRVVGSWDNVEFWFAIDRQGLYSKKRVGGVWSQTRQPSRPNAPAPYQATNGAIHPDKGLLIVNHGIDLDYTVHGVPVPVLLSGLKGSEWTQYGMPYRNPERASILSNPNGLAIDPIDNKYVYFGSVLNGLLRINLDDPKDLLHMSHPADRGSQYDTYVKVADDPKAWSDFCRFAPVMFDNDGTLWTTGHDIDNKGRGITLWYWTPDMRRNIKSAASFRPFGKMEYPTVTSSASATFLPLKSSVNKNIIAYYGNNFGDDLVFIDHKGTLDSTADDDIVKMSAIYDQDGGVVTKDRVKDMLEDPETGLLWVATTTGVFTVQPRRAFTDPQSVNLIKVSREDGSELADYLLNGVSVNKMTIDGAGRKWFATMGAGVVCTSADGRTIISEFTTDNSVLPDNNVTGVIYNPSNHSMMFMTMHGLVEYFLPGASTSEAMTKVRAYPNPVRPDYYGWVTIDGLTDNAIVKIVDNGGNLVRELGPAQAGSVQWDCTNMSHKRVQTGVYYIMASNGPNSEATASVGKIMVMN